MLGDQVSSDLFFIFPLHFYENYVRGKNYLTITPHILQRLLLSLNECMGNEEFASTIIIKVYKRKSQFMRLFHFKFRMGSSLYFGLSGQLHTGGLKRGRQVILDT